MSEPRAPQNSPFWTFSLRLYAAPGVAEACLALQDKQGADVNLLLFMLWAGQSRRHLSAAEVRAFVELIADWRNAVVVPLRQIRRALRTPPGAIDAAAAAVLRKDIKKAELESERLQQAALFAFQPIAELGVTERSPARAAAANVATYAAALATEFDRAAVAAILAGLAGLEDEQ